MIDFYIVLRHTNHEAEILRFWRVFQKRTNVHSNRNITCSIIILFSLSIFRALPHDPIPISISKRAAFTRDFKIVGRVFRVNQWYLKISFLLHYNLHGNLRFATLSLHHHFARLHPKHSCPRSPSFHSNTSGNSFQFWGHRSSYHVRVPSKADTRKHHSLPCIGCIRANMENQNNWDTLMSLILDGWKNIITKIRMSHSMSMFII